MRAALWCVWAGLVLAATSPASAQSAASTRPEKVGLPGTAEGGWREFRGDPRNLGVSHGPVPALARVRWRFVADSELRNSPAVAEGSVIFGSRSGRLFRVRTTDGTKIWERPLAATPDEKNPHGGFMYSSPLVRDGRVTIGSEDGHVYCASLATGELLWRRHLGGAGADAKVWSSPKTDETRVFVGSLSGMLWALDPATGDVRWKVELGGGIGATVGLIGTDLVVPAKDRVLYLIDSATGAVLNKIEMEGYSVGAPALHGALAYVRVTGGKLLGVDLATRGVRWSSAISTSSYAQTSAAAEGDTVYAAGGSSIAAVDAAIGGEPRWQMSARKGFDASPVIVGGYIVAASQDQNLYLIDRKTGAKVKEFAVGEAVIGTPAIVDGIAYVPGGSGTVFAVE